MAWTDTDIGNAALSRIGYSAVQISSFSEDSEEAVEVNFWYDKKLTELLELCPWEVMKKWGTLELVEEDPNEEYAYSYRYPTDCVFAHYITVGGLGGRIPSENGAVPYTTGMDDQGKLIYTDQSPAVLVYTAKRTNTAYWSSSFASALAWMIAVELVVPLSRDVSIKVKAEQAYENALKQAQSNSFNEVTDDPWPESRGVQARGGGLGPDRDTDSSIWY